MIQQADGSRRSREESPPPGDEVDLRTLLGRLNRETTQLLHDELELAKVEGREVADAFRSDLREAGKTATRDLAATGVALSLAFLGGQAATAGALLGIGRLLGGAYWAGGLIVGGGLLGLAAIVGAGVLQNLRKSSSVKMERGRRTLEHGADVVREEARTDRKLVRDEAREFAQEASPRR